MNTQYYAVIQAGYSVFGVGTTKTEAIAEAREWVEGDLEIVDESNAIHGDMIAVECDKLLHDTVKQHGGDVVYDENENGVYTITAYNYI